MEMGGGDEKWLENFLEGKRVTRNGGREREQ